MIGLKFNRLKIIEGPFKHLQPSGQTKKKWKCECDCGVIGIYFEHKMKSGHTKSCGCYSIETHKVAKLTHGKTNTSLFNIWVNMRQRCGNANNPAYHQYGGRGITVCERWLESFENFYEDMGDRPSPKHSIDRIDNDGGYELKNCRWAEIDIQSHNRRDNVYLEHNNRRQTISEWADEVGIKRSTICQRIYRSGWIIHKALTTPLLH